MIPNPALPLLALLAAAGVLAGGRRPAAPVAAGPGPAVPVPAGRGPAIPVKVRLREAGLAWAALGFAGIALLAPALRLPTGVPSPAADLSLHAPWAAAVRAPVTGNPVLRDVTYQIQPWQLFLRAELRRGRLPLWNPHQFAGAPFWNGQSAPLFPLHLLFAALPLGLGLVLLPWLRLVAAGCGTFVLGRELGLSLPAALVAALAFPLSGMLVSFLLFPMGNALALVPWVLWAVERLASGASGAAPLALLAGLQLLAGHPETVVHTGLLAALYLLVRGAARPARAWLGFAAGWLAAAAVAAVHLLPLALLLPATAKWQPAAGAGAEPPLGLLLLQPLRAVLPQLYGHPAAGTWWGPFNYSATAVYAGALALPLAGAGLARAREDRRWAAVAALLAAALLGAYHWPGVRDLLAAPPLLGRVAHHRLIFGIELGLALLAGAGLDRWLAGRGRGLLAGAVAAAALLAAAWAALGREWLARGLAGSQVAWTAGVAGAALLAALSLRLPRQRRWALAPIVPALVACDLLLAHGRINPGLPLAGLYPETGAVRFLRGRAGRVAGMGEALRPNAAMVYGLDDVRGDDPVKLARYERTYGELAAPDPVYFRPIERWSHPGLDRLGVRWVVAAPTELPADPAWRLAYAGADARIYERSGALPVVRWAGEPAAASHRGIRVIERRPGAWRIGWHSFRPATLVVAETWDRGWRARAGGKPLPVQSGDGALLAVRLPAGAGRLELDYRPPGLAAGAALSLAGLLAAAALACREKLREAPV